MKTVLILRGLPASGKSTYAKQLLAEKPGMYKRLNKDEFRAMFDNGYHTVPNEKFIERMRDMIMVEALKAGKHIIIDDTNLSDRPIERIKQVVQQYKNESGEEVHVEIKDMQTTLEESLARDQIREKKVGEKVIMQMYKQHFLKNERGPHYKPQNENLPKAVICDLDGTLAIIHNRSPFDASACENDLLNEPIATIIKNYAQTGHTIIFMSGRDESARAATLRWLERFNIPFHHLYMRSIADSRKDSIIKKEMFEAHVQHKYFVQFVLDDRNQVVDLWRLELGLPCLQVNYGDF